MEFIKKYKYEIILFLCFLVYVAYFTTASFLRYDNFYTGRFDLGNMSQTVWNSLHGRIFELTDPNGTNEISRLAIHADFLLIFLAPSYLIWDSPKMLLLIQTLVIGSGAIFVYLIAKEILKNKNVSLVFALAYLLNPAVQYTNLYEFHAVSLATTFLLGAFYFIIKKRFYYAIFFLFLAGITKEQIWVINALIGIYLFIFEKKRLLGGTIAVVSGFLFYYLVWHAIPQALGAQHFALSYYSDFGNSPTSVVRNIIFSPLKTIMDIFEPTRLSYIKELFLPFGYVSLFAPLVLLGAIPSLLINLLSNNPQLHEIYYQYSADSTPFIFLSAILGVRFINRLTKVVSLNVLAVLILIYSAAASYNYGPLLFAKYPNNDMFTTPVKNRETIDKYLSNIPQQYSISATNNLGSHLSHRQKIYTVPLGIGQADVVAFLLDANSDAPNLSVSSLEAMVDSLEKNPNYHKVFETDNFVVFKKNGLK